MNSHKQYSKVSLLAYFLKGSLHFFIISVTASLMVTVFEMLVPQIIRSTVDSVIGDTPFNLPGPVVSVIEKFGGAAYLKEHLYVIAILVCILAVLIALSRFLTNLNNAKGAETLMQTMRDKIFAHIQKLPFSWHMVNQTGDIIQRCTSDLDVIKTFVAEHLTSVIRIVIMIVLSLSFMFSMDLRLALIVICAVPIVFSYSFYFHHRIGDRFQECDENEGLLSTIAQENLTGIRVVHAFGRENFEKERFEKQNVYYTGLWVDLMKLMSSFWAAGDLISCLLVMTVLVSGTVFCVHDTLTAGELIAFLSYTAMLTWPLRQLGRVISEMSKAGVSIDRICYIMNSKPERIVAKGDEPVPFTMGDIEYHNVSFGYDPSTPVVDDVSFKIPAGTTFGILGSTGSGKSTVVHLLNRLYDLNTEEELPQSGTGKGTITIGGNDIACMDVHELRRNIGMVLQEPFLFSRTIKENIAIKDPGMDEANIRKAAKIACVDDAISEFVNGYDTIVGERGVTLSGGQKQRTAIARMLTGNTPIMVFDDSLSAVDAETDSMIREALKENLKGSTVILISHRITTLMHADCIIVMDHGKIIEKGNHEQLLSLGGTYKHIYDLQMQLPPELEEELKKGGLS